jgi:hypothetical protein
VEHRFRVRIAAHEAAASRLYGGIQFRSDNEAGLTLGRAVGAMAVGRYASGATSRQ